MQLPADMKLMSIPGVPLRAPLHAARALLPRVHPAPGTNDGAVLLIDAAHGRAKYCPSWAWTTVSVRRPVRVR